MALYPAERFATAGPLLEVLAAALAQPPSGPGLLQVAPHDKSTGKPADGGPLLRHILASFPGDIVLINPPSTR